jgi:hypothetical protein
MVTEEEIIERLNELDCEWREHYDDPFEAWAEIGASQIIGDEYGELKFD